MTTKKAQHRRSVETLVLSEHGDEWTLTQIQMLINAHQHTQPYSRNCLLRIQAIIADRLDEPDVTQEKKG